jgi:multimeric flavodoxin WrbA
MMPGMKVLALCGSARRGGNSETLARALLDGASQAGHDTELIFLSDRIKELLADCRSCRDADGRCTIDDGYEDLILNHVVKADALVYATPVYWYGVSGQLKVFLDRLFCLTSTEHPDSERVIAGLAGKPAALLISAEESYPGATLGIIHELQEFTRYVGQKLEAPVIGIGNSRGEVGRDPQSPVDRAMVLGSRLFDLRATDYRIDTVRPSAVWPSG